jgi:hypothetical protein
MATIDPNIAMGFKPIQVQDPLNRMAAMMQIEGGQQSQQLNALKIREAEQEIENRNALRNVPGGINDPDYIKNVAKFDPKLALALQKEMALRTEADLKSTGLGIKNFTDSMSQYRNVLDMVRTPEQLLAWQEAVHKDPITGSRLASMGIPYDSVKQQLLAELQKPGGFEAALTQSKLGATKFAELNKPNIQNVTRGGVSEQLQTPGMGGAPVVTRTAAITPTIADTIAQQRLNADLNPDVQASLSTAREIGKLAAGQSPLAPKVIAADAGKNLVGDVATQMGNSYLKLFESGGIKSTTRGAAANLAASSQSSMLGQIGGGVLGTENQSERDFIKSQRPILVQGIVKATGMTASQINSNVELKNLLDSATDPDKGYETNAKNLNLINRRFGTGTNIMPEKPNLATKTPDVEALLKKYE